MTYKIGWRDLSFSKQEELTNLLKAEFTGNPEWVKNVRDTAAEITDHNIEKKFFDFTEETREEKIEELYAGVLESEIEAKIDKTFKGEVTI